MVNRNKKLEITQMGSINLRGHATFRTLQGHFCQGANSFGRLRLTQWSFIKTLEACQVPLLRRDPLPCWRPRLPAESAALVQGPGESLSPPHSFWEGLPAFSEPSHARWQGADDAKAFCNAALFSSYPTLTREQAN